MIERDRVCVPARALVAGAGPRRGLREADRAGTAAGIDGGSPAYPASHWHAETAVERCTVAVEESLGQALQGAAPVVAL